MKKIGLSGRYGVRWCERVTDVFLVLLLSAFILICSPYEHITQTKYISFLLLCGGYLLTLAVSIPELFLLGQLTLSDLRPLMKRIRLPLTAWGAYLLFTAVSAVLSPYSYHVWTGMSRYEGLGTQLLYFGVFLGTAAFGRLKDYHFYVFGVSMTAFCTVCFLQLGSLNPFSLYPQGVGYYDAYRAYGGEYIGTIGNADLSAALLVMAAGVFYTMLFFSRGKKKLLSGGFFLIVSAAVFLIRVSAGIAAFLGMVFFITPAVLAVQGKKLWKAVLVWEFIAAFLGLAGIFLVDLPGGTVHELHELLHGRPDPSFGSGRIRIWTQVLREMPKHLLWGTGPDTMTAWELPGFTKYIEHLNITVESGIDIAHNEFLNAAAQQGLFAGLAFVFIPILSLVSFFRQKLRPAALTALAAAAAYLIQALFGFSMCMTAPLFWAFLGLSQMANLTGKEQGEPHA